MNPKPHKTGLVWLRRDLRAQDNTALQRALHSCEQVHVAFLFDRSILKDLPRRDRRVEFIRESLVELDQTLRTLGRQPGCGLITLQGLAPQEIPRLAQRLHAQAVFASHDDEPQALARDAQVRGALAERGVSLHTCKDHLVFERSELLTQSGQPYTVFTPYKNAWLKKLGHEPLRTHDVHAQAHRLAERPAPLQVPVPELFELGFERSNLSELRIPTGSSGADALFEDFFERMDRYGATRDFPAVKGPSYLGVHLRFGTVSIRHLVNLARQRMLQGDAGAAVWLSELIWREFYAQLLHHHPQVVEHAFKPAYDAIRWERGAHAQALFQAWCEGRTGYPLVDAAMAQLLQTGYMHNRLRMVTASFLCKDLGLDWRWGEAHFALHLNDFDLASNNGGWQWASSSGCDAQPWFRIFNPVTQSEKFDPEGRFIQRYLPQLAGLDARAIHAPWSAAPLALQAAGLRLGESYPLPLVQHEAARERTLARYAVVKKPLEA